MAEDTITRFTIDNTPIRGQLITMNSSWQQCLQNSNAKGLAREILGHALAAVSLLASTLKINGKITLQIRGQGAIHLLVAEATSRSTFRGLIRQSTSELSADASLAEIFQTDKIVITIDSGKGEPYQGIAPLSGSNLSQALESYFEQSEQLPTRLWLSCNKTASAGLLLQKLPGDEMEDSDSWNRINHLASTITDQELTQLDSETILQRLFHQESVTIFNSELIHFDCSCSRERTQAMIKSLGNEEANSIIHEQGSISINCEFCNAEYIFDVIDVKQIFSPPDIHLTTPTQH